MRWREKKGGSGGGGGGGRKRVGVGVRVGVGEMSVYRSGILCGSNLKRNNNGATALHTVIVQLVHIIIERNHAVLVWILANVYQYLYCLE